MLFDFEDTIFDLQQKLKIVDNLFLSGRIAHVDFSTATELRDVIFEALAHLNDRCVSEFNKRLIVNNVYLLNRVSFFFEFKSKQMELTTS